MGLKDEIEAGRRTIKTDGYSMSVGELTNLYSDGELDVHPEFQRIYRWTATQKTRLIESLLLGIPLPSIFVAQRENGVWDVVDGVQRISTILEFMGLLQDDDQQPIAPLVLEGTRFLPSLEGRVWESPAEDGSGLTGLQRIDVKRAKVDVKIIQRESDPSSKYELFQRLNGYGTPLTSQEIRSCLLISLNRDLYYWLKSLAEDESFLGDLSLPARMINEQYHYELALRFVVFRSLPVDRLAAIRNLNEFLTDEMVRIASDTDFSPEEEAVIFRRTFELLHHELGGDVFRKYDHDTHRFQGPFLITAFEVIGMGVGYHRGSVAGDGVTTKVQEFWGHEDFQRGYSTGVRADTRMAKTIPFGRSLFQQ